MEEWVAALKEYAGTAQRPTEGRVELAGPTEEIEIITKQVEAGQRLFQKLYEVDVEGVVPALKIDPAERP